MTASSSLILLAGMHRSGTSLLASLLPCLGVPIPGELIAADIHNPEGYYERADITDLQERLQIELGRWWPSASGHLTYSSEWLSLPSSVRAMQRIEACIRSERAQQPGPWGLKDPRISLLLPLWQQLSRDTGLPLRLVISVRDPAEVMVSLQQRDGLLTDMTPWRAQRLIWRHLQQLLLDSPGLPTLMVSYGAWFEAAPAEAQLLGLAHFCQQAAPPQAARRQALERIRPEHRRSLRPATDLPLAIHPLLLDLHGRLEAIARLEADQQNQALAGLRRWLAGTPRQLPAQTDHLPEPMQAEAEASPWFEPAYYREQCLQQGLVLVGSELDHFRSSGWPLGLSPCRLADPIWAAAAPQRRELWPAGRLEGLHPWGSAALALSEGEVEAALERLRSWQAAGLSGAELAAISAADGRHFELSAAAFEPAGELGGTVRLQWLGSSPDDQARQEWLSQLPWTGDWQPALAGDSQATLVAINLTGLEPGEAGLAALGLATRAEVVFDPDPSRVALLRRLGVNARLLNRPESLASATSGDGTTARKQELQENPAAISGTPGPNRPGVKRTSLVRLVRKAARKLRRGSLAYIHPVAPGLHNFLFFTLRRKVIALNLLAGSKRFTSIPRIFLSDIDQQAEQFEPLVSIIVPNYNHAAYLTQRLDSIFNQSYRNFEVILLDDASSDGSQQILHNYHSRHPEQSRLVINEQNSGSPFQQWRRGLELANGELVWIAESDDFCDPDFLSQLIPNFANPAMMLAFCRVRFVDESGSQDVWAMHHYLPELEASIWEESLVNSAHKLTRKIWHRRNLIPNVSAAIFRNCQNMRMLQDQQWQDMKICGDWLFYLHVARGGLVGYTPETNSYYRQHPQNTSVSLHSQRIYLEEHLIIAEQLFKLYRLDTDICNAIKNELHRRWHDHRDDAIPSDLLERIQALHPGKVSKGERDPNLLIVTYSLIAGGGEILPIRLANALKRLGLSVTVLNCHQYPNQPGVRRMLHNDIPLIELNALDALDTIINDFGIDLVHSHHAWVDTTICELLHGSCDVCHVITSHGMYNEIEADEMERIGALLRPWLGAVTYVADRNLDALLRLGLKQEIMVKIANAIDPQQAPAIERSSLGIGEDAFVVCLVSRGIREKGWQEAIEAVQLAREQSGHDIHLLILGDGKELHRLRPIAGNNFIHFLGFQAESGRYFACADLGILPSFYPGESQPLTLLECLGAGRPYLATDLGEIKAMLSTPEGLAGQVIPLEDGKVNPQAFADCLRRYLDDPRLLQQHTALACIAAQKFDPVAMGKAYTEIYRKALTTNANPTD